MLPQGLKAGVEPSTVQFHPAPSGIAPAIFSLHEYSFYLALGIPRRLLIFYLRCLCGVKNWLKSVIYCP
jgi:hypothetical protein